MSRFFRQFSAGFSSVWNSYGTVAKLRPSIFLIVTVATIIFIPLSTYVLVHLTDAFVAWLLSPVKDWAVFSWIPSWLASGASGVGQFFLYIATFLLTTIASGSVVLILICPLLSIMAERIWVSYGGDPLPTGPQALFQSILRAVWLAVKYFFLQMLLLFVCFLIGLFPVVGIISPVLSFAVTVFFYGTSLIDYGLELAGKKISDSYAFCKANRGLVIGIGLPYALALFIPYVGRFAILFVAPLCVAGAVSVVASVFLKNVNSSK